MVTTPSPAGSFDPYTGHAATNAQIEPGSLLPDREFRGFPTLPNAAGLVTKLTELGATPEEAARVGQVLHGSGSSTSTSTSTSTSAELDAITPHVVAWVVHAVTTWPAGHVFAALDALRVLTARGLVGDVMGEPVLTVLTTTLCPTTTTTTCPPAPIVDEKAPTLTTTASLLPAIPWMVATRTLVNLGLHEPGRAWLARHEDAVWDALRPACPSGEGKHEHEPQHLTHTGFRLALATLVGTYAALRASGRSSSREQNVRLAQIGVGIVRTLSHAEPKEEEVLFRTMLALGTLADLTEPGRQTLRNKGLEEMCVGLVKSPLASQRVEAALAATRAALRRNPTQRR